MSVNASDDNKRITRETLNQLLSELAKEYKKLAGKKTPAEIVMLGGAVIVSEYGFRGMTEDIDAVIQAASAMKEAIARVEERYDLPHGWINTDFMKTSSYSRNLVVCSSYYRTINQTFNVRVVKGEYLIAMKLRSYRDYKNDISDIVGILAAHKEKGEPITMERIEKAVVDLYGSWEGFYPKAVQFIKDAVQCTDYDALYSITREGEKEAKEILLEYENRYPGFISNNNVKSVVERIREKKKSAEKNNTKDIPDRRDDE